MLTEELKGLYQKNQKNPIKEKRIEKENNQ
jgi:hypothetical protein